MTRRIIIFALTAIALIAPTADASSSFTARAERVERDYWRWLDLQSVRCRPIAKQRAICFIRAHLVVFEGESGQTIRWHDQVYARQGRILIATGPYEQ